MIDAAIDRYCDQHSYPESPLLKQLRAETAERFPASHMISGPQVAALLALLIRSLNATHVLDVGTYTGYSALVCAEALPDEGRVITLESAKETLDFAKTFFKASEVGYKVQPILGDAKQSILTLKDLFDVAFIDADKMAVPVYVEAILTRLKPRGVIVVDDVLWYGKVLDPQTDKRALALHAFNESISKDPRVHTTIWPIRHGVHVIQLRG